ncbi:hypothetical protein MJO28_012126 [Puccinia striiformis f. sp. tritici]|uniref:Uncharacterized protein n=1 Tax=Puccinia striiformis f. sp. tritici TaxID=168172 RepID=A0ACC0DZ11_9BASI|nr:hypothetical protein MJO28_012126 [Puccinia striiformis f. sp. tritici]KAI7945916.1 hypothetical protein MJO29_012304 [Puccinia striiformis f. sp. tritici]
MNSPLNLIPPNQLDHDSVQLDYPPKSPDELPCHSATRTLLSSPISSAKPHLPYQLTTIPLHLPKPRLLHPRPPQSDNHQIASFAEECRKMFYTGDPIATKNVENIIKNLPAASKAAYTKQMATVRSQFHRDAASSRRAEVDKLLHDTLPSSIIIKAVGNDSSLWAMRSPRARQERLDRLKKFINAHCVRNMVGVHPFFNSLCAVLHLMSLPARKSGSGKRRIDWEIDLALFCEAGGEPFLVDSIQFLKGVLGFEDHLKPLVASSLRTSIGGTSTNTYDAEESEDEDEGGGRDLVIGHADGDDGLTLEERQELEVDEMELLGHQPSERVVEEGPFADSSISVSVEDSYGQARGLKGKMSSLKGRDRALSDPFLDPAPHLNRAISQEHSSPRITVSPPATEEVHHQPSPLGIGYNPNLRQPVHRTSSISSRPSDLKPTNENLRRSPTQNSLDAPPPTETRIFRSPSYLTTSELRDLINLFPSFITVRTKPLKFDRNGTLDASPVLNSPSSGTEKKKHSNKIITGTTFAGHGVIKLSVFEKDPGWKGSFFERISMFFFRLFKL